MTCTVRSFRYSHIVNTELCRFCKQSKVVSERLRTVSTALSHALLPRFSPRDATSTAPAPPRYFIANRTSHLLEPYPVNQGADDLYLPPF